MTLPDSSSPSKEVPVSEQNEWPPADPGEQAVLISLNAAFVTVGGYAVWRRSRAWFALWLAAFATWGTLCKYLI